MGSAFKQFTAKRPLCQKEPLRVSHVLALEQLVHTADSLYDRVAAGHFLMMVFGRARYADLMALEELEEDYATQDPTEARGYIEARTRITKTGTSREKRTAFLPLTAPTQGLGSGSWARAWVLARVQTGVTCGAGLPGLPAPSPNGGWQQRPATAQEAINWMRALLVQGGIIAAELRRLGTHS